MKGRFGNDPSREKLGSLKEARFNFNDKDQQYIIDELFDRDRKKFGEDEGKARVTTIKEHVTLLTKKLIIIVLLGMVSILGLVSLVIGVIAYQRNCTFSRQPSLPIWLLVLGGTSILLVVVLVILVRFIALSSFFSICFFVPHLDYCLNDGQIQIESQSVSPYLYGDRGDRFRCFKLGSGTGSYTSCPLPVRYTSAPGFLGYLVDVSVDQLNPKMLRIHHDLLHRYLCHSLDLFPRSQFLHRLQDVETLLLQEERNDSGQSGPASGWTSRSGHPKNT